MPTPFGSVILHRKLTDTNTRDNEIENLLKNTRSWKHPTEEVENWISHIKQKYDEIELKEEANKVSQPITTFEFINYFKKKTEKTESSPSGRHIGHYKSILINEDLVNLHVIMLNIPLKCGFACQRWKIYQLDDGKG